MSLTKVSYSMIEGDVRSVVDYGVVGDGQTDDTLAMQDALNDLGTGSVLLLQGLTIIINDRLLVSGKSGFAIDGQGGTIKAKNGMTVAGNKEMLSFRNCSDFTVSNLVVDGNRANRTPAEVAAHSVEFRSCKNFICQQVRSINAVVDGFIFNTATNTDPTTYCLDFQMINCFADNCYRQGASVVNAYNFKFSGGAYTNTNGTAPEAGIDIESDTGATIGNRTGTIENCSFTGNNGFGILTSNVGGSHEFVIQNSYFSANKLGGIGINTDATHVLNCVFRNHTGAGITQGVVTFQNQPTIRGGSVVNCRFAGNTNTTACIYTYATTSGIDVSNNLISDHVATALTINGTSQTVSNNSVWNCSGVGIETAAVNSVFANNYFNNTTGRAIYVVGGSGCKIINNTAEDISTVSGGYIQTDVNGTILENNVCASTTSATTTYGIYLGASSTNNVVVNNTFTNLHSTQPIGLSGTVISQHIVYGNVGGTANDPRRLISGLGLPSYTSGGRPTSVVTGQCIFDTTLGYPIWYNGSNWVNASGTTV